jgi:hypothetical protein
MDRDAFDGLTKLLASSPNRRKALGALLGAGLAGSLGAAEANKSRKGRRGGTKGAARLAAEATCASPGPSANLSGCDFSGADFSGDDLSGSRLVATIFRGADLAGANLSSSNAKNAVFREADLSCANLRSSTLGGADFRGADLTQANLKSSGGCNTALFNAATTFCATTMCDGSVRNDDCPGGFDPTKACCAGTDCPGGQSCIGNQCVAACTEPAIFTDDCNCFSRLTDGAPVCIDLPLFACAAYAPCSLANPSCPGDQICVKSPCCEQSAGIAAMCVPPCPFPAGCVCPIGFPACGPQPIACGKNAALRRAAAGAVSEVTGGR